MTVREEYDTISASDTYSQLGEQVSHIKSIRAGKSWQISAYAGGPRDAMWIQAPFAKQNWLQNRGQPFRRQTSTVHSNARFFKSI